MEAYPPPGPVTTCVPRGVYEPPIEEESYAHALRLPSMRQPLDTIPSDEQLPASADVVVIGGGIAGVRAAYWLAKRGVSVALDGPHLAPHGEF